MLNVYSTLSIQLLRLKNYKDKNVYFLIAKIK